MGVGDQIACRARFGEKGTENAPDELHFRSSIFSEGRDRAVTPGNPLRLCRGREAVKPLLLEVRIECEGILEGQAAHDEE